MNVALTDHKVLAFIEDYRRRWGMTPSYREIAVACGFAAHSAVRRYILRLQRQGFLGHKKGEARAMTVYNLGKGG